MMFLASWILAFAAGRQEEKPRVEKFDWKWKDAQIRTLERPAIREGFRWRQLDFEFVKCPCGAFHEMPTSPSRRPRR